MNSGTSGTTAVDSADPLRNQNSPVVTHPKSLPNGHMELSTDKLVEPKATSALHPAEKSDVNESLISGTMDLSKDGSSEPVVFLTKTTPFWVGHLHGIYHLNDESYS